MKIEFSDHANLKIKERNLLRKRILATIAHPDGVRLSYGHREVSLCIPGLHNAIANASCVVSAPSFCSAARSFLHCFDYFWTISCRAGGTMTGR